VEWNERKSTKYEPDTAVKMGIAGDVSSKI
jgi:hypothetical protein